MKHIIAFLCSMFFSMGLFAQTETESTEVAEDEFKDFTFVYIAHEENDAVDIITQRLKEMKDKADQYGNAYIFYMANGATPIIVKYNLEDGNPEDFNLLLGELNNSISNSVDPVTDMDNICSLIDQYDFLGKDGKLKYFTTSIVFYVGADFWTLGYNETLLAKLYFIWDIPALKQQEKDFAFEINCYKGNYPRFEPGKAFGEKNLIGINKEIILQYSN